MNDIRYKIILYWSQADQAFIAEVPELPGCAADGPTYKDAVSNAEVVIREWIEAAQALGHPIPAPLISNSRGDVCPLVPDGIHHYEIEGYPYTIDDPKMITGERRVANYICRRCSKTTTFDYNDYQDVSPM